MIPVQERVENGIANVSNDVNVQEIKTQSNDTLPPMVEKYLWIVPGRPTCCISPTNQQGYVDYRLIQCDLQPYKKSPIVENSFWLNVGFDDESSLTKCDCCHFDRIAGVHQVFVDPYLCRCDVYMAFSVHSIECHSGISVGYSTKKITFRLTLMKSHQQNIVQTQSTKSALLILQMCWYNPEVQNVREADHWF